MTKTQTLHPTAVLTVREHEELPGLTVRLTFPHAGTDRIEGQGWYVGADTPAKRKLAARLMAAINAGAVVRDAKVATDVNGNTYVACTSVVYGRTMNADLKRLGY